MAHVALTPQQTYAKQHRVSNVARPSERLLLSRGQGVGRHGAGNRECRQAMRGRDRRAWGRLSRHGRLL